MEINFKPIEVTGEQDNQFVGLKINNNVIEFHYPESYKLSPMEDKKKLRSDILAILRSITLAKTYSSSMSSYNTQYNNSNIFPLSSYLWLINDYLTYGRYENREKKYMTGIVGKVDWHRTLKTNPIISNGNIIYTNIISEKKDQKENIITEIYRCCVKKSMDAIGWLYGLTFDSNGIDYDGLLENNYNLYLIELNNAISNTFDDNKKNRLHNMKNVLTGLDENVINTREMVYGVDSYDYVYERMIDCMFSSLDSESKIKEFYPNSEIHFVLNNQNTESSYLRPDTVMIKDKNVYILDAKNYRYGTTFNTSDVPETTSIQKQITYGEYVKLAKKGMYDNVYSAFIMPYSKEKNIHKELFNKNIVFVAKSQANWYEDNSVSHRNIANILIDMNFLINNWTDKNQDNLNEIIECIEKNIEA